MTKLKSILFEIGEGQSIDTYDYQKVGGSDVEGKYAFKTEGGYKYYVDFEVADTLNTPWAALTVGFGVMDKDSNYMTGEGRPFKVLNTVFEISENHIRNIDFQKYSGIRYFVFIGISKSGEREDLSTKRSRIYKHMLETKFRGLDVKKRKFSFGSGTHLDSGEYWSIDIKDENDQI